MKRSISLREAFLLMRFFVRLEQQIDRAIVEGRREDSMSLARLCGALQYRIYDGACIAEACREASSG